MRQKWVKRIGNILTILSFIFIIRAIFKFEVNFQDIFTYHIISSIFILAVFLSTSVFLNSLAWKKLIEIMGNSTVKTLEIFHVYARANLGKYLPGNFMHYVSRNIIGEKYKISQKDMLSSTIAEIMLKILSALILVIIFVRDDLLFTIEQLGEKTYLNMNTVMAISLLIPILLFVLSFYKNTKIIDNSEKVKGLFYAFFFYIIVFIINVLVFIFVTFIITNNSILNKSILSMSGIYLISWLLGYLTPGSPGGVGIRETIMILMLGNVMNISEIVLISITIRIITIMADVIAYLGNVVLERRVYQYEVNNSNTLL